MGKEKKGKQEDVLLTIVGTGLVVFFALSVLSLLSLVYIGPSLFPVFLLMLVLGILSIVLVTRELKGERLAKKKSVFLTVAGILTIIAACFSFVTGLVEIGLSAAWSIVIYIDYGLLMRGMLGIAAFVFGITAGTLVLKRRLLPIVVGGVAIVLVSSLWTWFLPGLKTIAFLILVAPVLIPIIISIIIIGALRGEFSD